MNNIPFLFTVLLSVLAWTTNQIVSSLEKEPILEVTSKEYDKSTNKLTYVLTNISSNKLFKELTFEIYGGIIDCFGEQDVILGPPNMKSMSTPKPKCNESESVDFTVDEFHPSSTIKLVSHVKFLDNRDSSALYVKSNNAIKVVHNSLQTFLIKHKLEILITLFVVWFILIVIYVFCVRRNWLDASS